MRLLLFIFIFLTSIRLFGNKTSSEIYVDIQKLHSLKRVLYIAAHPDDENTRALAYFSLGEKAETAYLSLTRGDGGQNLIGNELSENLGVLRTQELLSARSIDGAKQFFTRAVDFGYSRSAEESFKLWGKDEILSDVVLVIRQFKPDVIITRFPPDERAGHGHHTASALLAIEAFEKAADPNYLPEQVKKFGAWKTTAVYWNSSSWWDKELADKAKDNDDYLIQDIGGYNQLLGMSYNQIGTYARSEHKCQGFGGIVERGSRLEYFQYLAGDKLENSFFEKDQKTWRNLGNAVLESQFSVLLNHFNFKELEKNIPLLLEIRGQFLSFEPSTLRDEKLFKIDQIIQDCSGLSIELTNADYAFVNNENLSLKLTCINRSNEKIILSSIEIGQFKKDLNLNLIHNSEISETIAASFNLPYSGPYWLKQPFTTLFSVQNPEDLGKAEESPILMAKLTLQIKEKPFIVMVPATYKWADPSYGERRRNVISVPHLTANYDQELSIVKPGETKTIKIKLHAFKDNIEQDIHITTPKGWKVSPEMIHVEMANKHEEKWIEFQLTATEESVNGKIHLDNHIGNSIYSMTEIAYDHIPTQVILKPAHLPCLALDTKINPGKVAYIKGVDDAVPKAIEELGFELKQFEVADLANLDLSEFKSVVLGIRIYNVHPELKNYDQKLFDYVKNGGNLIMQYNTASRTASENSFGPYPFELSRNRVTEEDAEVIFLVPDHPIMNKPNKITQEDFKDWVQERGLYFADNWDKNYVPLFSWHDTNQDAVEGGLIVTKFGKGQFVYTGISFFRELPKGVSGAYKLFANLLSYQP